MSTKKSQINRRKFLSSSVAAGTLALSRRQLQGGVQAASGPALRVGLIGCGGRGTGAAFNALDAAKGIEIFALGDVFDDRLEDCRSKLSEKGNPIADSRCFVGFDAYREVIAQPVDYVILATPPHFRAEHFEAIVAAGRHSFIEKPVAVDPVGIRRMLAAADKSVEKGLCVVAGTQRRHQQEYLETYQRVRDGAIGEIVAARGYWNQGALWHKSPQQEWDEMEAMIRDWVNWCWLSGDHIVEQHVHQIDVIHWFTGENPVRAVGFGSRVRRPTGDQFDFFSVDYEQPNGVHFHSMCRQINGCENNISEYLVGTRGSTNCQDTIYGLDGSVLWKFEGPKSRPYEQEHTDLIHAIRTGNQLNEAHQVAHSTLTAIMGRVSAYTGRAVTRDALLKADFKLGPKQYGWGEVQIDKKEAPRPGRG